MNRVAFLIDGFNLYHSVRDASRALGGVSTKWLDIDSLCREKLSLISKDASLEGIYYFSALAHHLSASNPDVVVRHQLFLECLQDCGISVEIARFKPKTIYCPHCSKAIVRHEEKETDVAIAAKLLELLHQGACETVVIVTGDTDVAPAVRIAQRLHPQVRILFAFPFRRKNNELAKLARGSFKLSSKSYVQNQFANPYVTHNGKHIVKPASW